MCVCVWWVKGGGIDRQTGAAVLKGFILTEWGERRLAGCRKGAKALMAVGLMLCH